MSDPAKDAPKLPNWQEFQAGLVAKATKDEAFRTELLADPTAAVEKEIGRIVPGAKLKNHLKIRVVEANPDEIVIILPPGDAALREADLDNVAGGRASSDIVMTGGGPGPSSTPFVFKLENVKMT